MLTLDSVSKDLLAAGTVTDPDHPTEVAKFNLPEPAEMIQLTNANAGLLAGKKLAKTEEITFNSTAKTKVQGWVVKPPDFDPSKSIR